MFKSFGAGELIILLVCVVVVRIGYEIIRFFKKKIKISFSILK